MSPSGRRFCVYNAAFSGYNLHQYLLRLIDQGPIVKPHYVVVGVSYTTNLCDLLPPDRGSWFTGGDQARNYLSRISRRFYDEIWDVTFAGKPNMSRTAAIERVDAWCEDNDVTCIETLDAMRAKHRQLGRWVHWRKDAHPTPEGQDTIAQVVFDKWLIKAPSLAQR